MPYVDVISVLWKSTPFLEALFEGLVRVEYPHDRMTVHFVDNGPGDGSLDEVKRLQEKHAGRLPPIVIHEPGKNTGFSGGNNLVLRESIEKGHEYGYLLNHDAAFEEGTLREAVTMAETDEGIGSVQSLIVLQQSPDEVNSTGNAIHFLGFGYCAGYHEKRSEISPEKRLIAYASGAGVLLRTSALRVVGCFDETLFAYHEDLDLGWRMMLAGYRNVLAPKSVLRHRYEFSRSIAKWFWMERNRMAVVLKNYHLATLLILAPQLFAIEIIIFLFALYGGWGREKLRAWAWFWKPSTWTYLARGRKEISKLRKLPDHLILERFTPIIAYQEFESPFITTVANPLMRFSFAVLKNVVRW